MYSQVMSTDQLAEIQMKLAALPDSERAALLQEAFTHTQDMRWLPTPGPQMRAYFCEADDLFYGGEAGGGKTDLLCGLAVTAHHRSLLMKRFDKDKRMLYDRIGDILNNPADGGNSQAGTWRFDKDKLVDLGGCETEADKQRYKGKPHDLIGFDEIPDFTLSQFQFIKTWNRTVIPGQRCRVVATGNPPTTAEGLWVIDYWAPWLDPRHPDPAADGELRWYVQMDDGRDMPVPEGGFYFTHDELPTPATRADYDAALLDKTLQRPAEARSRTFIRSRLTDNPFLMATDYGKTLDALPAEIRAAYRDGKFDAALKDNPAQVIPTSWVMAAQERWKERPMPGVPMCVIAADVARGGEDKTVISSRYDAWFSPLVSVPGIKTPLGTDVAGLVLSNRRDNALVVIDMGGGYGGAPYEHLRANNIDTVGFNGAEKSNRRTRDKRLRFVNKRAEAWWQFREALDPAQEGGSEVALPKDQALLAELTTPTFSVSPQGIKVEGKEDVKKRIGRSTDHADAVIMAWSVGQHDISAALMHGVPLTYGKAKPKVIRGYGNLKRKVI